MKRSLWIAALLLALTSLATNQTSAAEPVKTIQQLQKEASRASTKKLVCIPTGRELNGSPEVLAIDRDHVKVFTDVPVDELIPYGWKFGDVRATTRAAHRWAAKKLGRHGRDTCAVYGGERSKNDCGKQVVRILVLDPSLVTWMDYRTSDIGDLRWPSDSLWRQVSTVTRKDRRFVTGFMSGEDTGEFLGVFGVKHGKHVSLQSFATMAGK